MKTIIQRALLLICILSACSPVLAVVDNSKYILFYHRDNFVSGRIYFNQFHSVYKFNGCLSFYEFSKSYFCYNAIEHYKNTDLKEVLRTGENVVFQHFMVDNDNTNTNIKGSEYITFRYYLPLTDTDNSNMWFLLAKGEWSVQVFVTGQWGTYGSYEEINYYTHVPVTISRPLPTNLRTSFNYEKETLTLTWNYREPSYETPYFFAVFRKKKNDSEWKRFGDQTVQVRARNTDCTGTLTLPLSPADYDVDYEYAVTMLFERKSADVFNSYTSQTTSVMIQDTKTKDMRASIDQPDKLTLTWAYDDLQLFPRNYRVYRKIEGDSLSVRLLAENRWMTTKADSITIPLDSINFGQTCTYVVDLVPRGKTSETFSPNASMATVTIPCPKTLEATLDEPVKQLTLNWSYDNPMGLSWLWHIYRKEKSAAAWQRMDVEQVADTGTLLTGNAVLALTEEDWGKEWVYAVCLEQESGRDEPSDNLFTRHVDVMIAAPEQPASPEPPAGPVNWFAWIGAVVCIALALAAFRLYRKRKQLDQA